MLADAVAAVAVVVVVADAFAVAAPGAVGAVARGRVRRPPGLRHGERPSPGKAGAAGETDETGEIGERGERARIRRRPQQPSVGCLRSHSAPPDGAGVRHLADVHSYAAAAAVVLLASSPL